MIEIKSQHSTCKASPIWIQHDRARTIVGTDSVGTYVSLPCCFYLPDRSTHGTEEPTNSTCPISPGALVAIMKITNFTESSTWEGINWWHLLGWQERLTRRMTRWFCLERVTVSHQTTVPFFFLLLFFFPLFLFLKKSVFEIVEHIFTGKVFVLFRKIIICHH